MAPEQSKPQKTLRQWESAVDKQIREAQERGDFDRLPGQGRPLPEESWEGDWALAYHVLRQAGETLPWISLGKDIETAQAKLRRRLEDAAQLRRMSGAAFRADRERARARYLEDAAAVDRMLVEYSFSVPVRHLDRGRLPLHIAAQQFDAACPS